MKKPLKLTANGNSTTLVIDKQFQQELGWKKGDNVVAFVVHGCLVVRSLEKEISQHMKIASEVGQLVEQGSLL
jgi:antitoxin component of MazEF toxin-antitoxin module